jgi:hypothetical protein
MADTMFLFRTLQRAVIVLFAVVSCVGQAAAASRIEYTNRVNGAAWFMWQQKDFNNLDAWAEEFRNPEMFARHDRAYGIDFYQSFWEALSRRNEVDIKQAWARTFKAWTTERPNSPTPYLAHAAMLLALADHYRGGGYIDTVAQADLEQAMNNWTEAREFLLRHKDRASVDYAWYEMIFQIEMRMGHEPAEALTRLVEGIARYPYVDRFYVVGAGYLMPKWGGSWPLFNGWVESAVKNTRPTKGVALYYHIYAMYMRDRDLYHQPALSSRHWSLILQGLGDAMQQKPDIDYDLAATGLACSAHDAKTVEIYLTRMLTKKTIARELGTTPESFCPWGPGQRGSFKGVPIPLPTIE